MRLCAACPHPAICVCAQPALAPVLPLICYVTPWCAQAVGMGLFQAPSVAGPSHGSMPTVHNPGVPPPALIMYPAVQPLSPTLPQGCPPPHQLRTRWHKLEHPVPMLPCTIHPCPHALIYNLLQMILKMILIMLPAVLTPALPLSTPPSIAP